MSGQLDQILAYLDKPGVTEVLIGNGRPVTFRRNHENVGLTKEPLSKPQLGTLIKGTPLFHMIPPNDGTKPSVEIQIGERVVRITASRRGDEVAFRIEKVEQASEFELELSPEVPGQAKRGSKPAEGRRTRNSIPVATERKSRPSIPVATSGKRATRNSIPIETEPLDAQRAKASSIDVELPTGGGRKTRNSIPVATERKSRPSIPIATETPRGKRQSIPVETTRPKRSTRPSIDLPVDLDLGGEAPAAPSVKFGKSAPSSFAAMIELAKQRGASDLHVATNRTISMRVLGEIVPMDPTGKKLNTAEAEALLMPLLSLAHQEQLATVGYVDLALEAPGGGRLRTNVSRFQGGLKGTFRIARKERATLEQLSLPKDLGKHVQHHQGLVIVAGPSGHGKTTTLAALVDMVNASRPFHIITVEDPIEIVYPRRSAVVSQREVGPHTKSFAAALKGSLREDPDVIVIGELRDRETVEIALTAAETGHLVIATMSTPNAAKTIDRLVDMFPPEDQSQVRASIAGALRAIIAQRLLPSAAGDGVHAAVEVLTGVLALSAMIREDKLFQLPNLMQRGKAFGMIRFDDSLIELVKAGKITAEVAIGMSENKKELAAQLGQKPPEPPAAAKKGGFAGLFGRKDS